VRTSTRLAFAAAAVAAAVAGAGPATAGRIVYNSAGLLATVGSNGSASAVFVPQLDIGPDPTFDSLPTFSPDGSWVAFQRADPRIAYGRQIELVRGDGGSPRRLTAPPTSAVAPAWSEDTRQIAYYRSTPSGDPTVAVSDVATGRIMLDRHALRRGLGDYFFGEPEWCCLVPPSWAPDGELAYERDGDVWVVDVATGRVRDLTRSAAADSSPQFSPDGAWIAWVRSGNIHVMRRDGTGKTRVSFTAGGHAHDPRWSPDLRSHRLAFVARLRFGNQHVFVTTSGFRRARDVWPSEDEAVEPAWSPDGKALAVVAGDRFWTGPGELWVVSLLDRRDKRKLDRGAEQPVWRPVVATTP
jgi:Tol biopolymer transport system component